MILPLLQPDDDLDWAVYRGPESLVPARRGLLEPVGTPLGPYAIGTADCVIVPGLAVDRTGLRLGRGGGSYDRALGRVPVGTFTCVVLHASEVRDEVPADAHDRQVTAVVTEDGAASVPAEHVGVPRGHAAGLSTSVSSVARRTASAENGHGAVRPSSHMSTWSV